MEQDSNQPSSKLLEPVNLVLSVKRNLAASWYQKMAAIEVDGDLKPMKVCSHKVRTYSQLFKVTFHAVEICFGWSISGIWLKLI